MHRPAVAWRDLVALTPAQVAANTLLSAPWLLGSWALAQQGWWLAALPLSAAFFLTALRQAHDSYHASIGLPRGARDGLLLALSATMLCSTHAIRHTHLQHHVAPMADGDEEGAWARLPAWQAVLCGPLFAVRTHRQAWQGGSTGTRRWMALELALIAGIAFTAACWDDAPQWLRYHVLTMGVSNALVGFFAVWSVHHGCDAGGFFARTERRTWANRLTANLLFHAEHHLFAQVPANHLPQLAARLDAAAPEWARHTVIPRPA